MSTTTAPPTRFAELSASTPGGFEGPLPECDPDRCTFCNLDPADDTLHREDCPAVANGLCGVIWLGGICLEQGMWHPHRYRDLVTLERKPELDDGPTSVAVTLRWLRDL